MNYFTKIYTGLHMYGKIFTNNEVLTHELERRKFEED